MNPGISHNLLLVSGPGQSPLDILYDVILVRSLGAKQEGELRIMNLKSG